VHECRAHLPTGKVASKPLQAMLGNCTMLNREKTEIEGKYKWNHFKSIYIFVRKVF